MKFLLFALALLTSLAHATCTTVNGGGDVKYTTQSAAASGCAADNNGGAVVAHCTLDAAGFAYANNYTSSGGSYIGTSCHRFPNSACPALGSPGQTGYVYGTTRAAAATAAASSTCLGSCGLGVAALYDQGPYMNGGTTTRIWGATWPSTGQACSPSSPTANTTLPPETCASGQFKATVNGITKCYTAAGTVAASTDSAPACTTTTTTSRALNTPTTGVTTDTITATDSCTGVAKVSTNVYPSGVTPPAYTSSTTTVNNSSTTSGGGGVVTGNGPGGSVVTTEATPGQDMSAFCAANPSAAACKTTNPQDEYCTAHPDAVTCKDLGTPTDADTLGTLNLGPSSLTPVSLAGAGSSCPADVALPHGMFFSYAPICTFATGLAPIIIAMAWLAAGLIVIGAKGSE